MRSFRLSRLPMLWWISVLLLATLTGIFMARLAGAAQQQALQFGPAKAVPVATRAVQPGEIVSGASVEHRNIPDSLLPSVPVATNPVGRTAAVHIFEGEVLLEAKLGPKGIRGPAALLNGDQRAIAVPSGAGSPDFRVLDKVDVLATFEPGSGEPGEPTLPVAQGAVVIEARKESVTIAVSAEEAKRVAFALTHATVTVVIAPG